MDKVFKNLLEINTPPVNDRIVNSLVVDMMRFAEKYIDEVMRVASKSFPKGLNYLGYERCTPQEEFRLISKITSANKRICETSRSDVYMMKYLFEYEWIEEREGKQVLNKDIITRYIHLPFVSDAGGMFISGKKIFIHPVMGDRIFNPTKDSIFCRLMRDRIIFNRLYYPVFINHQKHNSSVIYAELYRNSSKNNNKEFLRLTKAKSTTIHYLLGKFGFSNFFNNFFGFVPEVGIYTGPNLIDDNSYLIRSTGIKPKTFTVGEYVPSEIYIRIPKQYFNNTIKEVCTGIFYIIDHFPKRARIEYFDDVRMWQLCLGYIVFNGNNSTGKIMDGIIEHYNSLDEYVDTLVVKKMREDGIICNNFYELLMLVITNFSKWIVEADKNVNTMYGKELGVLYSVFYPITRKLFQTAFKLNKQYIKKHQLTLKEINEIMNKNFTVGIIYELNSPDAPKSSINYSGDNKFFKITSTIIPQATNISSDSMSKKKRITEKDPINKIHASIVECGGYLNITKPNPAGTGKINPYITLDEYNTTRPNPNTKEYFEFLQYKLFNKILDEMSDQ